MHDIEKEIVISIDPGMGGGIAWYDGNEMNWSKTPSGAREMANSVRRIVRHFSIEGIPKRRILVTIEQVHAMPHDGRSSLFKFGTNYGTWIGIFGTMNMDVTFISPQVWQKSYISTPSAFESKAKRKRYLKSLASDAFQTKNKKVTLATSDAILICQYSYLNLLSD